MARRRKLRPEESAALEHCKATGSTEQIVGLLLGLGPFTDHAPPAGASRRRLVKKGGDPRVMQFSEPEARARVLMRLKTNPDLEITAFSHYPWQRGSGLMGEEAQRVLAGKSIKVTGVCYTVTKRCICDACTYTHERLKDEGWAQPVYEGGTGLFTCDQCDSDFVGDLRKWPP